MMKTNSIKTTCFLVLMTVLQLHVYGQTIYHKEEELNGIEIGTVAPDFSAVDQSDSVFNLKTALQSGPVVLVFYRGQWCPFCNKQLSNLQDSLSLITEMGAQVVAVSPEKTEYLNKMIEKTGAEYRLLFDQHYTIADDYGVLFRPDSVTRAKYNTLLNANLSEAHGDESEQLPIPATYIIAQDGTIVWRHFDQDYKKRPAIREILLHLPK